MNKGQRAYFVCYINFFVAILGHSLLILAIMVADFGLGDTLSNTFAAFTHRLCEMAT